VFNTAPPAALAKQCHSVCKFRTERRPDPVCRHMTQLESVVRRLMFLTQCNAGAKVRAWMNCQLGH